MLYHLDSLMNVHISLQCLSALHSVCKFHRLRDLPSSHETENA